MTQASAGRPLLRAAATIAVITALARVAGFGRTAVFARSVGSDCVGVVYQTANTIPNIIFDIVAGGTLSALVVPLLAPALGVGDRVAASRMFSALLSWSALTLGVICALILVFAGPITRALLGSDVCSGGDQLGRRMLLVFAPQVLFYGFGIVLGGTLQAAQKFAWPALAPLLSSIVVVVAYLSYNELVGSHHDAVLPRSAELTLSIGTTAGVLALAACQLPAVLRLGLRLRPTLRFPASSIVLVRRAVLAGGITLAAQQAATAVMLRLANQGASGTLVVLTVAQAVYLLPWAVLAVPVATAVFPRLSASWDAGQRPQAAALAATAITLVSALAAIGTAALVSAARPIANVLLDRHADAHSQFAPAIAAFSVGLLGWSLVAVLARVLYSAQRAHLAAGAQAGGWLVTIVADLVLVSVWGRSDRAVVLAIGNALGVSIAAALLLVAAWRYGLLGELAPVLVSGGRAIVAAAIGSAAGWTVSRALTGTGVLHSVLTGFGAGLVGAAVTGTLLIGLDRSLLHTLRRSRVLVAGGPT